MYFIRRFCFLKCSEEGLLVEGGGMFSVHSEIYYVPIGDGWEEVSNALHYVPVPTSPWTQTLSLPPPGIEPGSPASQVGTLPKELPRHLILSVVCASL